MCLQSPIHPLARGPKMFMRNRAKIVMFSFLIILFSAQWGVARRPLRDSWRCSGCVLYTKGRISPPLRLNCKPSRSSAQHVKKLRSVDLCAPRIGAELPLRPSPDLMLPNNFHCPLSTGGRQITMPMHRYKPQAESPEAMQMPSISSNRMQDAIQGAM